MSFAALLAQSVDFHADLIRNIKGIRESQNLFDDLIADERDGVIAVAADQLGRIPTDAAMLTRPFDYGTVISYSFDPPHWQETRFSTGRRYGVWYGSLELETTVYETAFHWYCFLMDSFADEEQEIIGERRVFDVRCDALLPDLRRAARQAPELVSRTSYRFCQELGEYLVEQGQNGLLTRSARCAGDNAAIFNPARLSRVRDKMLLTYRCAPPSGRITVERKTGRRWLEFDVRALY